MKQRIRVLVIDNIVNNDTNLKGYLDALRRNDMDIETAATEEEAWEFFRGDSPRTDIDIALVDVRLLNEEDEDDISGILLARQLKQYLPVMIFTNFPSYEYLRRALGHYIDEFDSVDEFLGKAEGANKAVTAIRRIVSKTEKSAAATGEHPSVRLVDGVLGDREILALDTRRFKVIVQGEEQDMPGQNFDILKYFFENPDRMISHEEIDHKVLNSVGEHEKLLDRGRITNMISRIRKVIERDPKNPQHLKTVHGHGYLFKLKP